MQDYRILSKRVTAHPWAVAGQRGGQQEVRLSGGRVQKVILIPTAADPRHLGNLPGTKGGHTEWMQFLRSIENT